MSTRFEELTQRRLELQARCSVEREYFVGIAHDVERNLAWIDRTLLTARRFIGSPLLMGAGVLGTILLGPGRLLRWLSRATMILTVYRRLRR